MTPTNAAEHLAAIIFADLEVSVQPSDLTRLIRSRWSRIAPMAHVIHDAPDTTKSTTPAKPAPKPIKPKAQAINALKSIVASRRLNASMGGLVGNAETDALERVIEMLSKAPSKEDQ